MAGQSYPPSFADPGVATARTTPGPTATSPGQSPYGGVDWTPMAYEIAGMFGTQLGSGAQQTAAQTWEQQQENDINAQTAFTAREQGQQYGYQQQQFGVQQQGLGLSQQELGQQQQHLGAQYGFQQQQDVLSGQSIQANIQNILQNYGYQQQGFGIQQGQLNLAHTQATQGLAGAGTLTSTGARGQMERGFGLQQQQLNLAERQARTQEQFGLGQQQRAQKQLGLTEAEQKEQYGYSTQQISDGMKQLNLQQQQLGISEAQANTQYKNALDQLHLSGTMSVADLKTQLAAMVGGGWSPIAQFMGKFSEMVPFVAGALTSLGGQ